jgi:hypothetical protein
VSDLMEARDDQVVVALADGRAMVIGDIASVEALAADGSGWSALAPMGTVRGGLAAVVLPCGKVLVAGGYNRGSILLNTAELWDPATGAWSDLPPMEHERYNAACCVLPSGRVAVVGGYGSDYNARRDGEVFDPVARTWQPLPPMAHARAWHGVVAVAGGLLAVGTTVGAPNELFDEASGRWFALPHPMAQGRVRCNLVSLPAAAARKAARQARTMALAACAAQVRDIAAQVRDIGPLSAEEKARFEQEAGW